MRQRRWSGLAALVAMVLLIGAAATACGDSGGSDTATCKGTTGDSPSSKAAGGETADGAGKKVGIVLDIGGKNDKSFNQAAATGLAQAEKDFGVQTKLLEPNKDGSNREELLRSLADDGYEYIIGNGFLFATDLQKVAKDYPDISFAITDDASFTAPNVTSLVFTEEQGSYLVGAAAALKSKTHTIGFVGGVNTDLIKKFEAGYVAGAKAADKNVDIKIKYISNLPDASGFTDPASMKTIAEGMYEGDADVVYHAAGLSGTGLFPVAAKQDRLAIGVDSDQYQQVPADQQKCMLTSMLKRVDLAVYGSIKDYLDGNLKAGERRLDLKSGGIDYSTDGGQMDDIKSKIDDYKQKIISGEIKVPTKPGS